MKIVLSKHGVPVRLTEERMAHISRRHPEMLAQEEKVPATGLRDGRLRADRLFLLPLRCGKEDSAETVKLFEKRDVPLDWEYDGEADTLYICTSASGLQSRLSVWTWAKGLSYGTTNRHARWSG